MVSFFKRCLDSDFILVHLMGSNVSEFLKPVVARIIGSNVSEFLKAAVVRSIY
jgi:hypothetical protein